MRTIELCFGKWNQAETFFRVLSVEFDAEITSLDELEIVLSGGSHDVRLRYVEEPFGAAGALVQELLRLFAALRSKRGEEHFTYTVLPREQVTLDFRDCKYMGEVFQVMRKNMAWEDWYGETLDALWDILTGLHYRGDDITILRPQRYTGISFGKNKDFTEYMDKLCGVFQRAEREGVLTVSVVLSPEEPQDLADDFI